MKKSAIKEVNDWALREKIMIIFLKIGLLMFDILGEKKIGENILFLMISSHVIKVVQVPESIAKGDSKKGIALMMSAGFA